MCIRDRIPTVQSTRPQSKLDNVEIHIPAPKAAATHRNMQVHSGRVITSAPQQNRIEESVNFGMVSNEDTLPNGISARGGSISEAPYPVFGGGGK